MKRSDRDQFESLRAKYLALEAQRDQIRRDASFKWGPEWHRAIRGTGLETKYEKLRERQDKVSDAFYTLLDKVSPRSWRAGVPVTYVLEELPWEDVVRPIDEPLSVIPPAPFGYTKSPMRSNIGMLQPGSGGYYPSASGRPPPRDEVSAERQIQRSIRRAIESAQREGFDTSTAWSTGGDTMKTPRSTRANRGVRVDPSEVEKIEKVFRSRHWGKDPDRLIDQPDSDMPPYVVQMGVLVHIEVYGRRSPKHIDLDFTSDWKGSEQGQCHLAFATTKDERLYCFLSPKAEADVRKQLVAPLLKAKRPMYLLAEIASRAGGRQAQSRYPYPAVEAFPIGPIYRLLYYTEKLEDEASKGQGGVAIFDHRLADEGGVRPWLAVDRHGRCWICGGSYSVPAAGIRD